MMKTSVVLTNESGLHARPASLFSAAAQKFASKITLEKGDVQVDCKSIIKLMTLGITKGTEISIIAEGEDESQAVEALAELVKSGFGE